MATYFVKDRLSATSAWAFVAELLTEVIAALQCSAADSCADVLGFEQVVDRSC